MKIQRFDPVIKYLEEPHVEVGENIAVPDVKMGWTLLGPLGGSGSHHEIPVGLIGDAESLEKTNDLIHRLNLTAYGKDESFLHVDFPGLEKLRIRLVIRGVAEIDSDELRKRFQKSSSFHHRIEIAARVVKEKIKALAERDPSPDLLILAYPKVVDYYCIQGAIGKRKMPRKTSLEKYIARMRKRYKTLDKFLDVPPPESSTFKPTDLRSQVKATCMDYDIPVQILRPHTIEPYDPENPRREDDATTFWNLIVALYYKSNRLPWRVRGLMDDTCYLGIAFFRDRGDPSNLRTALAQVFSLDAEGFVFKGEKAVNDENNSPHVTKGDAVRHMEQAIKVYRRNKDRLPHRVVVHKTSRFSEDEIEGFKEGADGVERLDLVAFGDRNTKLVRWGQQPPIRGTMTRLPDRSVLLYTFGYIPYLGVYPGPHVPSPLEILEHHGKTSAEGICEEILALTKLNWNNAKFCTKAPITIGFARRVASILREIPPETRVRDRFKFYM